MKKLIYLLTLTIAISSCAFGPRVERYTEKIPLRQLIKSEEKSRTSSASFFLVAGVASSTENQKTVVKLMGNVEGYYRLIQFDLREARIKIDDSIDKPYIVIRYSNDSNYKMSINQLLGDYSFHVITYDIICPERYLPEKLLPITL